MFYGWKLIFVTFVTNFVSVGFIFYSYGVFFKALAADFGGSRLQVSLGLSIMQVATAALAPFVGRALDSGSIRNIMALGACLMSLGFVLAAQITALWHFYFLLGSVLALGTALLGGLASSTLIANWFVERRGTALGISTMGISVSGVVMAPLATLLIARFDWRTTFLLYGVVTIIVVLPLVWSMVVSRPEELGLSPDGGGQGTDPQAVPEPVLPLAPGDQLIDHAPRLEWSSRGALRDGNFWVIVLATALNFAALSAVLTHIYPHATDIGVAPPRAAWILSCMAGSGVLGKILFGWLADRSGLRLSSLLATAVQALGVSLLIDTAYFWKLILSGAIFGLGMGGVIPLWGSLVGAAFGRFAFGRVMGLMNPFMLPIHMAGVPLAAHIWDVTKSYTFAFQICIGFYLIAGAVLLFLRLPKQEPGKRA